MTELGLDLNKLPIGKLTSEKIRRGHQVLSEIQRLLVTGEKPQMIGPLTNDFYTTIPHNFGMKKPPVIDHLLRVKSNRIMLEQLFDVIQMQNVFLRSMAFDLRQQNPVDVLFAQLCVKLTKLDKDSDMYQMLFQSINNT